MSDSQCVFNSNSCTLVSKNCADCIFNPEVAIKLESATPLKNGLEENKVAQYATVR